MIRQTLLLATFCASLATAQDHGQGPVDPGPITVSDLNLGKHWFGPEVTKQDLRGKVVLVEIWGS